MDLHREIAQWLFAFRLIPPASPALRPNSQLSDLVAVLRDGVVLCQVERLIKLLTSRSCSLMNLPDKVFRFSQIFEH
jgi:hypothetical protein